MGKEKGLKWRKLLCTLRLKGLIMTTIKVTESRAKLFKLLDQAADSHQPIQITGMRSNAVLISEEDWRSIQETLYLLSIPGMRESIREGFKTPVEKCSGKPGW
jgi:antitoxin YefM